MSHVMLLDNGAGYLVRIAEDLERSGIEVSTAECVAHALEVARSDPPDLILSVEKLPGLDVLDLLELKHSDKKLADIPVVVVSTSSRRKLDCFRRGCDEFIELPVDQPEMIFRVCAVLRRVIKSELSGNFEQIGLVDVVQMLVAARRDGKLSIESEGRKGELVFGDGQVVHAVFGDAAGEDAFLEMLKVTKERGSFSFSVESVDAVQPSINKRTDHLLLGLANVLDEEGG